MTITIYVINGRSKDVGQWDLETYTNFYKARTEFEEYLREYGAMETGLNYASNEDRTTAFWIDEIEVELEVSAKARVTT